MPPVRVLKLNGTYSDMGKQHGRAYPDEIRMFAEDRVQLSMSDVWTGRNASRKEVIALAEACAEEHYRYAPDLMQEVEAMAQVTGVSVSELIINNGFTDFIDVVYNVHAGEQITTQAAPDDCTAVMIPREKSASGHAMFAQTWDMHASATPYVILIHGEPVNAPEFLTFTITGCIGMIGMNAAGITVGINNLMGGDGQIGVTWTFVARKILQQSNIDDALTCITEAKLAGAHNYIIMDREGNGYNVEAMSTGTDVQPLTAQGIAHTNHCLLPATERLSRPRRAESQASSVKRLTAAAAFLQRDTISVEDVKALTRDESSVCVRPTPPAHVESCGAVIMQPETGDFHVVWGLPSENEYEHFSLS